MPEETRDTATILEARARQLARPIQTADQQDGVEVLVLVAGGERYGVEIRHVLEVQPASVPTPVPGLPRPWAGVANLRGALYPVLDLARQLGLPSLRGRGMLILVAAGENEIALLVDEVDEARKVRPADIHPLAEGSDLTSKAVRGLTTDLLSILDLGTLFSDPGLTADRATV